VVVSAGSAHAALTDLAGRRPDLIISDYHISDRRTGIEEVERLRAAFQAPIAAFLISGDTSPGQLSAAQAGGYQLLHKPLRPMTLRAMLGQSLRSGAVADPVD
jgi:CheY-like chemotaxis protein